MKQTNKKLVQVFEHVVNENLDIAEEQMHQYIVEVAKEKWAQINEKDMSIEDQIQDYDDEDGIDKSDQESDLESDIEVGFEDGELQSDEEGEEDLGVEAQAEEAMDDAEDSLDEMSAAFQKVREKFAAYIEGASDDEGEGEMEMEIDPDAEYEDQPMDEYSDEEGEEDEYVDDVREGAVLKPVKVSHSDKSNKKSPIAKNAKSGTGAKAHKIDATKGKDPKKVSPKMMNVDGPQEAKGYRPYAAKKNPDAKSKSPIKGIKK